MTSPLLVQTSIVVKSTEASTSQWALRELVHVDWRLRSGASSMPCDLRMLASVKDGLKQDSSVHCEDRIRLPKSLLTGFPARR